MKLLIFLLLGIVISFNIHAQISHNFTLYSEDGLDFQLTINGKVINEEFASSVEMKDVKHDYIKAVIKF